MRMIQRKDSKKSVLLAEEKPKEEKRPVNGFMWKKVVAKPRRKKEELDELFKTRPLLGRRQGGVEKKLVLGRSVERMQLKGNTRVVSA